MAASDEFEIVIEGKGGHAALPQNTVDPVMITAQVITALHTIVSRNVDPMRAAVLSVTMIQGGEAFNIIPRSVKLTGTVRSLTPEVRDLMEERLKTVTKGIAETFGGKAEINYRRGYPVTVNAVDQAAYAAEIAASVVGAERVDANADPKMGGEDFSYMLRGPSRRLHLPRQRPGFGTALRHLRLQRRDHPGRRELLGQNASRVETRAMPVTCGGAEVPPPCCATSPLPRGEGKDEPEPPTSQSAQRPLPASRIAR